MLTRRSAPLTIAVVLGVLLTACGAPAPVDAAGPMASEPISAASSSQLPPTIAAEPDRAVASSAGQVDPAAPGSDIPAPSSPVGAPATSTPVAPDPECPAVRCLRVAVSGDVLLHEPLWAQAARDSSGAGMDFRPLLGAQAPYLADSDVALCHLETPVAAPGTEPAGYPEFAVPAEIAVALADVGYDACSTASNHTTDHGTAGLVATLDALDAAGLQHAGSARTAAEAATPTVIATPAGAVGLISATYGLNTGAPATDWQVEMIDVPEIIGSARDARAAGADVVVVSLHHGVEYQHTPTDDQRQVADELLASPDIDFVYGHHAHVVQPLQSVNGKWVAHGLGNAVAANGVVDLANREGLLVRVTFGQGVDGTWRTTDVAWVPSLVDNAVPTDGARCYPVRPAAGTTAPAGTGSPPWSRPRVPLRPVPIRGCADRRDQEVTGRPSASQLAAFFLLGCTRGGSPGIFGVPTG